jgi:Flp pilus assembly pilin Flp
MRPPISIADRARCLRSDCRGAIATEYAVLIGVCGIVVSAALVTLGPPLVASYQASRHTLIAPIP